MKLGLRFLLVTLAVMMILATAGFGAVPNMLNYQGRLTSTLGVPLDDTVKITFTIYDDSTGGTVIWSETQTTVYVIDGLFHVLLGSVNPINGSIFTNSARWLGVMIDSEHEQSPRTRLVTAGYAFHAAYADSAPNANPWSVSGDNIYRENGNVGIGTTNPSAKLQVIAASGQVALEVKGADSQPMLAADVNGDFTLNPHSGTGKSLRIRSYTDDGVCRDHIVVRNEFMHPAIPDLELQPEGGNVGIGTSSPDSKLDVRGITTVVDDCAGNDTRAYASLGVTRANQPTNNSYIGLTKYGVIPWGIGIGSNNSFIVGVASASPERTIPSPHLSIDNIGNVGIGTTSPAYKLDVAGDIRSTGTLRGNNLYLDNLDATNWIYGVTTFIGNAPSNGQGHEFLRNGEAHIGIGGNVGIGTTSPAFKLHVAGDQRVDGRVEVLGQMDIGTVDNPSDPKAPKLSVYSTDGGGLAARTTASNRYGIWGSSDNGPGVGCGTSAASFWALEAHSAGESPSNPAIWSIGRSEIHGSIFCNDNPAGVNAIEGRSYTDFAGVAGKNGGIGPGIYGSAASGYAGYFQGDVWITGNLHKGSGSFTIDHPLDPENKYLQHSFVESPDMMNIYNGNVTLDDEGEAVIEMPDYFTTLNKDFRYQLTCIGGFAPVYVAEEIENCHFKIAGGKPNLKISWQITGIRKDPYAESNRIQVVVEKKADERGKYLHPEAYGLSAEHGIGYAKQSRDQEQLAKGGEK